MSILISWVVLAAAFLATAWLLPGMKITGIKGALAGAAIFGLLNFFIGWFLYAVIGVVTLGLGFLLGFITRWVVNVILLKLTDKLSDDLSLKSTGTAMAAALLISGIASLLQAFVH
ncbi:MAG: phage holin family protein [Polyangiaceae bacterium]